jgi:hypothetical protein
MRASRRHFLLSMGAALALLPSRTPRLVPGAYATVTTGPSAGTIVRLLYRSYAPPGCDGCAVHTLQPPGPIWVVDKWLEWDVERPAGLGWRRYRLKLSPWTALAPVTLH